MSGDAGIVMASKLGAGDFGLSGVWSISFDLTGYRVVTRRLRAHGL